MPNTLVPDAVGAARWVAGPLRWPTVRGRSCPARPAMSGSGRGRGRRPCSGSDTASAPAAPVVWCRPVRPRRTPGCKGILVGPHESAHNVPGHNPAAHCGDVGGSLLVVAKDQRTEAGRVRVGPKLADHDGLGRDGTCPVDRVGDPHYLVARGDPQVHVAEVHEWVVG